jgi:hypothetical protein
LVQNPKNISFRVVIVKQDSMNHQKKLWKCGIRKTNKSKGDFIMKKTKRDIISSETCDYIEWVIKSRIKYYDNKKTYNNKDEEFAKEGAVAALNDLLDYMPSIRGVCHSDHVVEITRGNNERLEKEKNNEI